MKFYDYLQDIHAVRMYVVNDRTHSVLHKIDGTDDKYTWEDSLVKTSTTTPLTFFSEREGEKIARKAVIHDSFYFMDRGGLIKNLYNSDGTKR